MKGSLLARSWLLRISVSLCLGLLLLYLVRAAPLPFVSTWWGPEGAEWYDPWYRRHRMADWMLITGRFAGASRMEIVGLLGEPPEHGYFRGYDLVYQLGSERGFFSIDSEWLAIRLDSAGVVSEVTIVRD